MRNDSLILATIAASLFAGSLSAQATTPSRDSAVSFSVVGIQSRPRGPFGQNTGTGYGINGAIHYRVDRAGILSIRADVTGLQYGSETKRSPFSDQVGGRVLVDVNTSNYIVPVSIGAQLSLPRGSLQPYVTAGVGGVAFFTESTVRGTSIGSTLASTVNQSDFSALWTAGSGVYVKLREGRVPMMLDVGLQYMDGGRARYLTPGGIVDLPNGEIQMTPIESRTQMMIVRLGVRIGR